MRDVKVGLIGFGTIGTGVVKILQQNKNIISDKLGTSIILKKIADLDINRPRSVKVDSSLLTADANEIISDPEIDIVIELIGGINPAKDFIIEALKKGKHVVTANKALLAEEGMEIFECAESVKRNIGFEASTGGVIPVVRAIKEGFASDEIRSVYGIINGTANYILTKMTNEGIDFAQALKEAQEKGFAEADPTLDISGGDSAHKIAILSMLAFGTKIEFNSIYTEGIERIASEDIKYAYELGYKVKLLAIAKNVNGEIDVRVHPTMITFENPLSNVSNEYNAVYIEGKNAGRNILFGKGAGELPTAVAVVSDVIDIARDVISGESGRMTPLSFKLNRIANKPLRAIDDVRSRFYFRFSVVDRPGVLSKISGILGKNDISILSVIQKGEKDGEKVSVVIMTHEALEKSVRKSLQEIDSLDVVVDKTISIRVEE
ncbi:MAG: homoserine dehydrogenase [Candidatus Schekmanbacteria bacterium]|nr:MAG: homoserine dehydrogenase [Candidatus Schekmanbacteria bacterium]